MTTYILYILFTMSGLILMKLGGGQLNLGIKDGMFEANIGFKLLVAFFMYGISFLIWSRIVAQNDLTYIVPLSSAIVNILSVIVGIFIFKESLSTMQIVGIIVATIGVVMMNFTYTSSPTISI